VIYNPLTDHANEKLTDLTPRELLVLVPLLGVHSVGRIYPKPFLRRMEPSARQLIEQSVPVRRRATGRRGQP